MLPNTLIGTNGASKKSYGSGIDARSIGAVMLLCLVSVNALKSGVFIPIPYRDLTVTQV